MRRFNCSWPVTAVATLVAVTESPATICSAARRSKSISASRTTSASMLRAYRKNP
jgi:hypothetical protein